MPRAKRTLSKDSLENESEREQRVENEGFKKPSKVKKGSKSKEKKDKTTTSGKSRVSKHDKVRRATEKEDQERLLVRSMRQILYEGQSLSKMPDCVNELYKLMQKVRFEVFYEEFCQNIKMILRADIKNPHTKLCTELISRFLVLVKNKDKHQEPDEAEAEETFDDMGMELFGIDSFCAPTQNRTYLNLVDYLFSDILTPYLNASVVDIRLTTLYLIRLIITNVEDVDETVFINLKKALIDRVADRSAKVRCSAALALSRFQDVTTRDDVYLALQYHCKYDFVSDVRHSVLQIWLPSDLSIPEIVNRTKDVNTNVRKAAYMKIAKKVGFRRLSIDQRLVLAKNGVTENDPIVRKVFEKEVIPAWMKEYESDIIKLLYDLDISSDVESSERFLNLLFHNALDKHLNEKTHFHLIAQTFANDFLDDNVVPKKESISVEEAFFWRCIAEFLKKNEIEILKFESAAESAELEINKEVADIIADLADEPSNEENVEEESANISLTNNLYQSICGTQETVKSSSGGSIKNVIDSIIPDLSQYCNFITKLLRCFENQEPGEAEILDIQFIYEEFFKLFLLYEIGDTAQRNTIVTCFNEILLNMKIDYSLNDYITPLMKVLGQNVFNSQELLEFTVDMSNEIRTLLETDLYGEPQLPVDKEEIRKMEVQCAKLSVDIMELKDGLDEVLHRKQYSEADRLQKQIEQKQSELDELNEKTKRARGEFIKNIDREVELKVEDYQEVHFKLLRIFCGCMQYGTFDAINALIKTRIDTLILPGVVSQNTSIRAEATRALGLCCFVSSELSITHYSLLCEIVKHDCDQVRVEGMTALVDMIAEHGLEALIKKNRPDSNKSSVVSSADANATNNKSKTFRTQSSFAHSYNILDESEMDQSQAEAEETLDKSKADASVSDNEEDEEGNKLDEINRTLREMTDNDLLLQTTNHLVKLLTSNFRSAFEPIRMVAVKSACKLLLLDRLYSPRLLCDLIILWYKSSTIPELKHLIGIFLPVFAFAPIQSESKVNTRQRCLSECFLETIEKLYLLSRGDFNLSVRSDIYDDGIDSDNVITFMFELLTEENQISILIKICKQILILLQIRRDDDFELKEPFLANYLIVAVSKFRFTHISVLALKRIVSLTDAIQQEERYNELPKRSAVKIQKFIEKVRLMSDKLKAVPDTSIDKFDVTMVEEEVQGCDPNSRPDGAEENLAEEDQDDILPEKKSADEPMDEEFDLKVQLDEEDETSDLEN